MTASSDSLRVAVIGARRGRTFIASSRMLTGITLHAVCDPLPHMRQEWCNEPGIRVYDDYEAVLNDPKVDAVCIATPVPLHAGQAIAALKAGKHVLSEVTAAYTLEECHALCQAVVESGLTYMMAENYCYMEPVLQVQQMVEEGVFGEVIHASGSYLHDCRKLFFTPESELTWRGRIYHDLHANPYPTHSLGPVARWLGINRTDRFARTASWASRSLGASHYARQHHPDRHDYAKEEFWNGIDSTSTTIATEKGTVIDLRVDWASARPHHMTRYELQGTKASFIWAEGAAGAEPLIWIEGRSPVNAKGEASGWEPLFRYRDEYQHPLWREHGETAKSSGHLGSDFFVLREFANAIREGRPPMIDVFDAVTWSSLTPLSAESLARGNAPVAVPDFTVYRHPQGTQKNRSI